MFVSHGWCVLRGYMHAQVVLSFGIPFVLIPLIMVTRDATVMGDLVNNRATTAAAVACSLLIIALNVFLLVLQFGA